MDLGFFSGKGSVGIAEIRRIERLLGDYIEYAGEKGVK